MEKHLIDTLVVIKQTLAVAPNTANSFPLDTIYKISMIFIAVFNVVFAVYIFLVKSRKDDHSNEKNRKINLLKTLILDYNLEHLYDYFEQIDVETRKLIQLDLSNDEKKIINDKILENGKFIRIKFIDILSAINKSLYDNLIILIDKMQDSFTESIFDEGINLNHKPKFEEKITKIIQETKTSTIKLLFNYKGE
jgi:hypothetical protein